MNNIELSSQEIESEWLGFSGASEPQIVTAETRLGFTLPSSYREFLKVTNGWNDEYPGIPILRPVEKIDWFCVENQDIIDLYANFNTDYNTIIPDPKYMQTALQVSDDDDGHFILLNPKVIHNSEWEAFIFISDASHKPTVNCSGNITGA